MTFLSGLQFIDLMRLKLTSQTVVTQLLNIAIQILLNAKNVDGEYFKFLLQIMNSGEYRKDRTGTGTLSVFAPTPLKFDLNIGFPLITTKNVHFKSVVHELLWFIQGSTNIQYLKDNKVKIWDAWSSQTGDIGRMYGSQLRDFGGKVDQLQDLIKNIKSDPYSRRHVITLWNPLDLQNQALACCHGTTIQFYVQDDRLSCHMYQRSADAFLGIPFNIASYALLTHMIAQCCDLEVDTLTMSFGDAHVYSNHIEHVEEQLTRKPKDRPSLKLNPNIKNIDDFKFEDIQIIGYDPHPTIKAKVSV